MLPRGHRQESLSRAYVRAVAAKAGLVCCEFDHDYGIDISLRDVRESESSFVDGGFQIDLQIKSTTRANVGDSAITYDLPVRNYNHLRANDCSIPRFLVLLVMPDDEHQWLTQSIDELIVRHCAYWLSLVGYPATESTSTVRIVIPKENVFSVPAVQQMLRGHQVRSEP